MKKLLIFLALLILINAAFLSCKTSGNTTRLSRILTRYNWEINEQYADLNGTTYHYKKGGENTFSYDQKPVLFTFNRNGTGTYTSPEKTTYKLDWKFNPSDATDIMLTLYYSTTVHTDWNMVCITKNAFLVSGVVAQGLVSTRLTPVKK